MFFDDQVEVFEDTFNCICKVQHKTNNLFDAVINKFRLCVVILEIYLIEYLLQFISKTQSQTNLENTVMVSK